MLSSHDGRVVRRMIRLEEEYRKTHDHANEGEDVEFTDPFTGREVPLKFHVTGGKAGEPVKWTELYGQIQRNSDSYFRLEDEFVETLDLVGQSEFDSPEEFADRVL
jgi:hypothetical protein